MLVKIKNPLQRVGPWMAFNPPNALSSSGWEDFNKEFKEKAPVRFWITDTLPAMYRPILRACRDASMWVRYRTTQKFHVVRTGLAPGYAEVDTMMLHVNFTLLKDFVEIQLANMERWVNGGQSPVPKWAKWCPGYSMIRSPRSPELGIRYINNPDQTDSHAAKIRELYTWWCVQRPARQNIVLPDYHDQRLGGLAMLDNRFDKTALDYISYRHAADDQFKLEQEWSDEDSAKLIELVSIRRHLWT